MKSRNEVSAGGVVYRRGTNGLEFLICKDAGYHRWVLPKGLIGKEETPEQAALREVREETGITARLLEPLGDPEKYVYRARGVLVFKSVHYFLMEYEAGDVSMHDHEMESVQWLPFDQALAQLAYQGAKDMLQRGQARIADMKANK